MNALVKTWICWNDTIAFLYKNVVYRQREVSVKVGKVASNTMIYSGNVASEKKNKMKNTTQNHHVSCSCRHFIPEKANLLAE